MAEAVGLAASVVTLIGLTKEVVKRCKFYIRGVENAPADLRTILLECSTLKATLKELQFLIENGIGVSEAVEGLAGDDGLISECSRSMSELDKLLPTEATQAKKQRSSKRKRVEVSLATLQWPFKQDKARKILEDLQRYKQGIGLAITTETMQDIKHLKQKTDEIQDLLTDSQRHELHRWLVQANPCSAHDRARKDYEPQTGTWFLSLADWTDWLECKNRSLLLHGIPGAGKTVLMSFLIEQTQQYCKERSHDSICCIYYYCSHDRNQDETTSLLRWILSQLCEFSNNVPILLREMFKYNRDPNNSQLLGVIGEALKSFKTVYVLIDALDESQNWAGLVTTLKTLRNDPAFDNIQLLESCREYDEIIQPLRGASILVSMNNPALGEDIRRYVHSVIHKTETFQTWPRDLLPEMEVAVSRGAQGMFRWAVSQLDLLRRLKRDRRIIEKQLACLPSTLFEIYDRILALISEEDRTLVHHVLQWLEYHNSIGVRLSFPQRTLIQATAKSLMRVTNEQDDQFVDADVILKTCGCLIRVTLIVISDEIHDKGITLAHYTVREYLASSHLLKSPEKLYDPFKCSLQPLLSELVLQGAREELENGLPFRNMNFKDKFHLFNQDFKIHSRFLAPSTVKHVLQKSFPNESLVESIICLFNPSEAHYWAFTETIIENRRWWVIVTGFKERNFWDYHIVCSNHGAKHVLNILSVVSSVYTMGAIKIISNVIRRYPLSPLFKSCITWYMGSGPERYAWMTGNLVEIGAWVTNETALLEVIRHCEGLFDPTKLLLICIGKQDAGGRKFPHRRGLTSLLEKMIALGSDLDAREHKVSPLQIAVAIGDVAVARILLSANADPNGSGNMHGGWWVERDSPMYKWRWLCGYSPLYICTASPKPPKSESRYFPPVPDLNGEMESLLLQYGGRAFCQDNVEEL